MNERRIAIKEKINELRAKQRKWSLQEIAKAEEIRWLIEAQRNLECDIQLLEATLTNEKMEVL